MQDNKQYTPELRFPEFHDDWQVKTLGECFDMLQNNTLSRSELNDKCGDYQNIHYGDVLIKYGSILDLSKEQLPFINDKSVAAKYEKSLLKDGDVIIADTAEDETVGKCTEVINVGDKKIISGLHTIPIRPIINFAKCFIGLYFNSNVWHSQLLRIMQGTKVYSISKSQLKNIFVFIPTLAEQRKIALCLSSLDDLIKSVGDKIELLKQHKKGLMQKLFPKKDCNVPELRFPEFSGDWQEKKLGDVTKVVNRKNKSNRQLPIYSINNKDGFVLQSEQFSDVDSVKRGYDISLYKIVTSNTFAYNPARINVGSIGFSGDIKEGLVSSLYVCFKTTDELDDAFLSCFFDTTMFKWAVDNNVEGGIRSYLFYENFSRIKIKIPSLKEQKRIAFCIASLDEEIKLFEDKHQKLQEHKKGLMQKMFVNKY